MTETTHERLQALDEKRLALLDEMETMDAEKLAAKPRPGKWSMLEIIEHLQLAEREILQGLPEPSQLVERKRSLKHRFTYGMVMFVLRSGIPAKVPSPTMAPGGNTPLNDLRRQWDQNQHWIRSYVEGLERAGVDRAVFAHPTAGPLTAAQAVHMDQLHLDRHLGQIRKLQRLMS